MILKVQITSIIFSFFYGFIFYTLLEINAKFIYQVKTPFKIINSFIFILFNVLTYFIILNKINNGIIHPYFLLSILTGYILALTIHRKLFVKKP